MMRRSSLRDALARFRRAEDGASLVEFSLVVLLFLFLLFAIIDFGRLANALVGANKATQIAARIATVRPPACPGVPAMNTRPASGATAVTFGTLCRFGTGTCNDPGEFSCTGDAANATANEIFTAVVPLLPPGTEIDNLRFRYSYDQNLGFLGGPYVPMVTVELEDVDFIFVSQLGQFVRFLTGNNSNLGSDLDILGVSVSLPGEDLAQGTGG
jgi:Flp pilus assembly pilin Flp